jgi:hypothetical protein
MCSELWMAAKRHRLQREVEMQLDIVPTTFIIQRHQSGSQMYSTVRWHLPWLNYLLRLEYQPPHICMHMRIPQTYASERWGSAARMAEWFRHTSLAYSRRISLVIPSKNSKRLFTICAQQIPVPMQLHIWIAQALLLPSLVSQRRIC